MQHIQWFPGHMTKAMRMMEDNLKLVDGIIIILDARASFACVNYKLEKMFQAKKVLYVLNKSDLVTKQDIQTTVSEFTKQGKNIVSIVGLDKKTVTLLYNKIFSMLKDNVEKNKQKGIFKSMRIMVSGIPNTGKSTIINTLCGSKKAITGDKAGVTKGKQWVRLNEIELLDTPGTMPPSFENQTYAKHLAYIGSINDDILDFDELSRELIKEIAVKYPKIAEEKYGITDSEMEPIKMQETICRKRGYLLKGGELDYERCSKAVIEDFRKGRLGKICLE